MEFAVSTKQTDNTVDLGEYGPFDGIQSTIMELHNQCFINQLIWLHLQLNHAQQVEIHDDSSGLTQVRFIEHTTDIWCSVGCSSNNIVDVIWLNYLE